MIIESTLPGSRVHRRTFIQLPTSLSRVLQTLIAQWDIGASSKVIGLIVRDNIIHGERCTQLVIDKESEWDLFCEESNSKTSTAVKAQLVTQNQILAEVNSNPVLSSPEDTYNRPAEREERQSTCVSPGSNLQHKQPSEANISTVQYSAESATKPKFAFQSVEPQKIKPRPGFSYQEREQRQQEMGSHTISSSDQSYQPESTAFEKIMAKSRMQGESLNKAFGALQAHRAGVQYSSEADNPQQEPHNTLHPQPRAEMTMPERFVETREEEGQEGQAEDQPSKNSTTEDVAARNTFIENAWQDRLKEMGHGPNSGSPYAKLRFGKGKERENPVDAIASGPSSIVHDSTPDNCSTINTENVVLGQAGPSSKEKSQAERKATFPSLSPEPSSRESLQSFNLSSGKILPDRPRTSSDTQSKVRLFRRAQVFKRRKSNLAIDQSTCSVPGTPRSIVSGVETPRSFNSSSGLVFLPQRRLSVKSLTESILSSTKDLRRKKGINSQGGNTGNSILSDVNSDFVHRHAHIDREEKEADGPGISKIRDCGRGLTSGVTQEGPQPSSSSCQASPETKSEVMGQEGNSEMVRPALLRATHTAPPTQTAVNLSSVDGITLHISSITDTSFAWNDEDRHCSNTKASLPQRPALDLFDLMLPREVRIACFRSLLQIHLGDAERVNDRAPNVRQQIALAAAMRELVTLSRVSKTWQSIVLDGQLWSNLQTAFVPDISAASFLRIIRQAGPFINNLDLRNMKCLSSSVLTSMVRTSDEDPLGPSSIMKRHRRVSSMPTIPLSSHGMLQRCLALPSLTNLNLEGQRSNISSEALHHTIVRLPHLQQLNIANLPAVTNTTLMIIGAAIPNLLSLNISRCRNANASGVAEMLKVAQATLYDRQHFKRTSTEESYRSDSVPVPLQKLRAVGLWNVDAYFMETLGRTAQRLQLLDLSYAIRLDDAAIEAFVSYPDQDVPLTPDMGNSVLRTESSRILGMSGPFVRFASRQIGNSAYSDELHYRRLHDSLTHVSFESCHALTDRACLLLAHCVPNLCCLEMGKVGPRMRDAGMIKLLETTPNIECIDVEDATQLSDDFLKAITPPLAYIESFREMYQGANNRKASLDLERTTDHSYTARSWKLFPPTGAKLTHLVVSHNIRFSSTALLTLIRQCPRLLHLEVDDTRANAEVLTEFVHLVRKRQLHGGYLNLNDCRSISRLESDDLFNTGNVRFRVGRAGPEFCALYYEGEPNTSSEELKNRTALSSGSGSPLSVFSRRRQPSSAQNDREHTALNDFDETLVVVKTFWSWQALDARVKMRRKAEVRRNKAWSKQKGRETGVLTARSGSHHDIRSEERGMGDASGSGRWPRLVNTLLGPHQEEEDAQECVII